MTKIIAVGIAIGLLASTSALAKQRQYSRQQQEAACSGDAFALCGAAIPDERRVRVCMIANRARLSPTCRLVLGGSLRR